MQQNTQGRNELDVRVLEPRVKHPTIHERLHAISSGESLVIINDHDPRPLRFELEADHPGEFLWSYLESGPELWQVEIKRA